MRRLTCLLLALAVALPAAGRAEEASPARVTIFAASSLKEAMDRIAAAFTAAAGHDVALSLAGSSVLARQIQAGAPADVFISASTDWMDILETDGLLVPDSRTALAGNRLVLIAPAGAAAPATPPALRPDTDLAARLGRDGRLAVALTQAVPAGVYARQALTALGHWDQVAGRLAETDNVRAALALVALGEAPLGIVYATDALAEPRVAILATFPATSHAPIVYPAARIRGRDNPAAIAFMAWLDGPEARTVLETQGFTAAPPVTGD